MNSPLFDGSVWSAEPQLTGGSLSWKVSIVKLEPVRIENWGNRGVKFLQTLQSRDNIIGEQGQGLGRERGGRGGTDLKLYSILSASGRSNLQNSNARYKLYKLSPLAEQTATGI